MNFLRRHLFLLLGIVPLAYLYSIDLKSTHSNSRHQLAVVLIVVFMSIYGVQRILAFRKKLRGEPPKDS
jgi:uncharacterized protein involved in response to NO